MDSQAQQQANAKVIKRLLVVVVGMFGFGFALVPLYDVLCDALGINGKTADSAAVYQNIEVDQSRLITVDFITRVNSGMPWEFVAETKRVKVHPGQINQVNFLVKNPAATEVIGQAIPSVSPGPAALYMNKTECFCFEQQRLASGQQMSMPMQFYVDPQLPEDITYFTVQYTLYNVTSTVDDVAMNRG